MISFIFTGYSGNGYYCTDIDECLTDNGGCSKNPKVQCINTMVSTKYFLLRSIKNLKTVFLPFSSV